MPTELNIELRVYMRDMMIDNIGNYIAEREQYELNNTDNENVEYNAVKLHNVSNQIPKDIEENHIDQFKERYPI